jgi:hypothetical protein
MIASQRISRRRFLAGAGAVTVLPSSFRRLAARELKRATIRDVQALMLQGPGRTYTLVKVTSDTGISGIAEAYGSPGVGVKEQVLALKPWLVGKDPLETITGEGGWMDQVLVLDRPYIEDGFIRVSEKPGLGIELNPDVVRAPRARRSVVGTPGIIGRRALAAGRLAALGASPYL